MRGEVCIGFASLLSLTSMILLALIYAGQTNTSVVARGISMVKIDTSRYHDALFAAFGGVIPIEGLYTQDGTASLGTAAGLRQEYRFGVTSYCAYVKANHGACGRQSVAPKFRPYSTITSDMPLNYSQFSYAVIPPSDFRNDDYLGSFTRTASYMLLLGFVFTGLSLITGIIKNTCTFLLATLFSGFATLSLLLGAVLWTVAVNKAKSIGGLTISASPISPSFPVGITVSGGPGLGLAWAAFVLMIISTLPYMIIFCTIRG